MKKILVLLIAFNFSFIVCPHAQTKVIYTIAGNSFGGYKGDGGPATAAELNTPEGIALDAAGNLYIADGQNNRIRMVNTNGVITTIAGNGVDGFSGDGGQATAAELGIPNGVALDASGNIYITENANNRVRMIDKSGIITTVAGNGSKGFGGDGGPATAAKLNSPQAVAIDAAGNFYIADFYNNRIRKVNTNGIISTFAGNGTGKYAGDGGLATAAEINGPTYVYVDNAGNVYIADYNNNCVRMVDSGDTISTIAGNGTGGYSGDGGAATSAKLRNPAGIIKDIAGNIYISDQVNERVRIINSKGIIDNFAGNGNFGYSGDSGAATNAQIFNPDGLALDAAGNLYIDDESNNCVREIETVLGINNINLANAKISLYPNPASHTLYLSFSNTKELNAKIDVLDVSGKELIKDSSVLITEGKVMPLDISGLAQGIYFVRITSGDQIKVMRFVKE